MYTTRIHLFITHLPVFGLFLGFFSLLFGFYRQDKGVKVVSLVIIIVAIVGGMIAFQTGEPAEETVESIAGISHDAVELHEESAELARWFMVGLGVLSMATLYVEVKSKPYARQFLFAVLVLSALTFYFVARTSTLGGKIRHTEIVRQTGDEG